MRPEVEQSSPHTETSDLVGARMCRCGRVAGEHIDAMSTDCEGFEPVYSSADLVHLTGVSYRMLSYYQRCGHLSVTGRGSGTPLWFSTDDLDAVRVVVALQSLLGPLFIDRAFHIAHRLVADQEYVAVLANVFELSIRVRDTAPPADAPDPTEEDGPS